jgi:F0F1-type ATP synthase beta subunit
MNKGKIVQVVGPVVDVAFPENCPNLQRFDHKVQTSPSN